MGKIIVWLSFFCMSIYAVNMNDLFNAIIKQPSSKLDMMSEKMAQIAKDKVESAYYPNIDMFASYTHYNSPTNLLPLEPKEAGILIAKGEPLPFSNTIEKVGFKLSIPVFVKEISLLSKKTSYLAKSAKFKKELNFYKNEAVVLGANAGLLYLESLQKALFSTRKSILKTKSDMQIAVDNGRMPGIAIDKIDEKLNQLEISINNIDIKRVALIAKIENLTGIKLDKPIKMRQVSELKKSSIFALKPLTEALNASKSDFDVAKAKRYYPKVGLNLMWSENYSQNDSNLHKSVHRGYGFYQLGVSMPLYNKGDDVDIQLKKIAMMKSKVKLKKSEKELLIDAKRLEKELGLLKNSQNLTLENIKKKKSLLEYAKVAFKEGRMTEEDYLRYEDGLLSAKASYYKIESEKWQDIAKLAVIYGNDLRGVVK